MPHDHGEFKSTPGSAGVASASAANVQRRERLRALALEQVDITNDPYFMKNHLGSYECKLCLTLHTTEGSYLAHTQGKRHQQNLARRDALLAKQKGIIPMPEKKKVAVRKTPRIGRPGYKVVKQREPESGQLSLLFQIQYPHIEKDIRPRYRFVNVFEQKVEKPDPKFQYLVFAADPYETIGFKLPKWELDKSEGKLFTHWDPIKLAFTLQLVFRKQPREHQRQAEQQQSSVPLQQSNPSRVQSMDYMDEM